MLTRCLQFEDVYQCFQSFLKFEKLLPHQYRAMTFRDFRAASECDLPLLH